MNCRFCDEELIHSMIDLGMSPLSNAYLDTKSLQSEELFYPLQIFVCHKCLLVQLSKNVEAPEKIFSKYLM